MPTSSILVVNNTSPVSNLAIVDRLELLRQQFGVISIPPGVRSELNRLSNSDARGKVDVAIEQSWIRVLPLTKPIPDDFVTSLDRGEAEGLALAIETEAGLVLLDESDASQKARQHGIPHTGVLGILRKGKQEGCIPSLRAEIARLRKEAHFFVHSVLEKELLASVGEA